MKLVSIVSAALVLVFGALFTLFVLLALNGFTTSRGVDALLAVYGLLVVASALLMFVIGPAVARRIRGSAAGLGAGSSIMSMGCSAGIGAALIVVATIVLIAVFGALR